MKINIKETRVNDQMNFMEIQKKNRKAIRITHFRTYGNTFANNPMPAGNAYSLKGRDFFHCLFS